MLRCLAHDGVQIRQPLLRRYQRAGRFKTYIALRQVRVVSVDIRRVAGD